MSDITGHFLDGIHSRKENAILRYAKDGSLIAVRQNGEKLAGPESIRTISISSRLGNIPRIISFKDGGIFETEENDAIDHLLKGIRPHSGLAHKLESKAYFVAVGLVVTIVFIWTGVQYGIPAAAERAAFAISAENNRSIGKGALEALDYTYVEPSELTEEEQERLRQKFLSFIDTANGIPVQIEFRNAEGSLGPNAFALPSGTIVFTDQLVELAESDQELLAVYAHEVGHVVRRHAMRSVLQDSAVAAIFAVVTGDISSVSSMVAAAPVILLRSGYSRDFEHEADRYAAQQLKRQGLDASYLGSILMRMENKRYSCDDEEYCPDYEQESWLDYLSTHPSTADRLRIMQEEMARH
ncbi:MAG: M48 family metallopeptidase [Burkholderiales bacterium]|jgi:Zn-dependent protease with chaperone function|nr:M48 family metallopeptidase [Burkholderiales bacterium]